jgi:hypothetical protein
MGARARSHARSQVSINSIIPVRMARWGEGSLLARAAVENDGSGRNGGCTQLDCELHVPGVRHVKKGRVTVPKRDVFLA